MHRYLALLFGLLLLSAANAQIAGATYDTLATGLSGTVSWSQSSNWVLGSLLSGIPGLGDNVQISDSVTLNVDVAATVGDFDFAAANLVVQSGDSLSCNTWEWRSGNVSMQGTGSFSLASTCTVFAASPAANQVMSGGSFSMGSGGSVAVNAGAAVSFEQCAVAGGAISAASGGAAVYSSGTSFTATTNLQGSGSHACSGAVTAAGSGQLNVNAGAQLSMQAGSSFANTSYSSGQYHLVVGDDTNAAAAVVVQGSAASAVTVCGAHQINAQGQIAVQSGAKLTYNAASNSAGNGQINVASSGAIEVQNNCEWRHAKSNFDYGAQLNVTGAGVLLHGAGHACTVSGGHVTAQAASTGVEAIHVGEDTAGAAQGTLNLQGHAQGPCGVHGAIVHIHSSGVVQHTAAASAAAPHVIVDSDTEFRGEGQMAVQAVVHTAAKLKCNANQHTVASTGELHVISGGGGQVSLGAGRVMEVDSGKLSCDTFSYAAETMTVGEDTSTGLASQAELRFKGSSSAPCHMAGHYVNVGAQGAFHVVSGGELDVDDVSECHGQGAANIEGDVKVAAALVVNHAWSVASTGSVYTTGTATSTGTSAGKVVVGEGQQLAIQSGGRCGHSGPTVANQGTMEVGTHGGAASSINFKAGSATSKIEGAVIELHDTASCVVESGANVEVSAESTIGGVVESYTCASGAGASLSGCYPACSPTCHCEAVQSEAAGSLNVAGQLVAHSSLHVKTATSVTGNLVLDHAYAHDFDDVTFASSAALKCQSSASSFVTAKARGTVTCAGSLVVAVPSGFSSSSKVALMTCGSLKGAFSSHSVVAASSAVPYTSGFSLLGNDYSQCFTYDYSTNTLWYDPNATSYCNPQSSSTAAEGSSSSASKIGTKTSWLWVVVAVVFIGLVALLSWLCLRKREKPVDPSLKQPLSPRRPSNPQSTAVGPAQPLQTQPQIQVQV